jgi:hypothetical protein
LCTCYEKERQTCREYDSPKYRDEKGNEIHDILR